MIEPRERRRLIALYDKTRNINFLRAAKCLERSGQSLDKADLLTAELKRGTGRPGEDDYDALVGMAGDDQIQHLALARGQAPEQAVRLGPRGGIAGSPSRRDAGKFGFPPPDGTIMRVRAYAFTALSGCCIGGQDREVSPTVLKTPTIHLLY